MNKFKLVRRLNTGRQNYMITTIVKADTFMGKTAVNISPEPPIDFKMSRIKYNDKYFDIGIPAVVKTDLSQPTMFYIHGVVENGHEIELIEEK